MHKRGKVIHFFHKLTLQLSTTWGAKKCYAYMKENDMPLGQNGQIITGPWPAICPYDNDIRINRHSL